MPTGPTIQIYDMRLMTHLQRKTAIYAKNKGTVVTAQSCQ